MASAEEATALFYGWEVRGRGWMIFDEPVELEPHFIPFALFGERFGGATDRTIVDDGVRHTLLSGLTSSVKWLLRKAPSLPEPEPYPEALILPPAGPLRGFTIVVPTEGGKDYGLAEQALLYLARLRAPLSFEIVGSGSAITIQIVGDDADVTYAERVLAMLHPGIMIQPVANVAAIVSPSLPAELIDLGLSDEFMRPLQTGARGAPDPLIGVIAALEALVGEERGAFQVLFKGTENPWAPSILAAVKDDRGGPFFADAPEMLPLAQEKVAKPLFGVVLRLMAQAEDEERRRAIMRDLVRGMAGYARIGSNELIPLTNTEYTDDVHRSDVMARRSRRLGMILNAGELAALMHPPAPFQGSSKLYGGQRKSVPPPHALLNQPFKLGVSTHHGRTENVTLGVEQRLRHMHLIGATGTGKSTLITELVRQDMEAGHGVAVIDPHGDLIEQVIGHVPDHRIQDVVLLDPSDTDFPIGLNILSAESDVEKVVLSSDLPNIFKRLSTSWGDQMSSVLANAINAFLEHPEGGTLIDLKRFLVESTFRKNMLRGVPDPGLRYYWQHEYPLLRRNAVAPILTRLDTFLRSKLIRSMMAQPKGPHFRSILDERKILLVKLPQGLIGEENSYLLGSLIVSKLHQAAMARQDTRASERNPFFLFIDEFQHFVTPSMGAILSGARKYGLGLVLAHQDLDQLSRQSPEIAGAVLANPSVRVCFRVGDADARKLEPGFAHFEAKDLQDLEVGEAILRVQRTTDDCWMRTIQGRTPDVVRSRSLRETIVSISRSQYGTPRSEIDELLWRSFDLPDDTSAHVEEIKTAVRLKRGVSDSEPPSVAPPAPPSGLGRDIKTEGETFTAREEERQHITEHRYLQNWIKKIGEERNFKATIEEAIPGGGRADVGLHRDELHIACEISVTNTSAYEVQNIEKCLKAGYRMVVVLSRSSMQLQAIQRESRERIEEALLRHVLFMDPDQFPALLDGLGSENHQGKKRIKGYRVKVNHAALDRIDAVERIKRITDIVLRSSSQ